VEEEDQTQVYAALDYHFHGLLELQLSLYALPIVSAALCLGRSAQHLQLCAL
jgi:hypothetical protein